MFGYPGLVSLRFLESRCVRGVAGGVEVGAMGIHGITIEPSGGCLGYGDSRNHHRAEGGSLVFGGTRGV